MSEGRENHLSWCKARALAYLEEGQYADAVASMLSDMNKRSDTTVNDALGLVGMIYVSQGDHAGLRNWIEGFR